MKKIICAIGISASVIFAICMMLPGEGFSGAFPAKVVSITASSTLSDGKGDYSAKNLMDFERRKCWCEGKKDDGVGEAFTVVFDRPVEIRKFYIFNGVGDEKYHGMNNRVKKFNINGAVEVEVDEYGITGEFGWRAVELPSPVKGKDITFKIVSVYKGTKWRDTCVAEIAFENPGIARWIKNPGNFPVAVIGNYSGISLQKDGTLTGPGVMGHQCETPFLGGSWKLKGDAVEFTYQYRSWTKCGNLEDSPKDDEWETNTVKGSTRTLLAEPE